MNERSIIMLIVSVLLLVVVSTSFASTPIKTADGGIPAVVNPIGWDKQAVAKVLDGYIKVCETPGISWAKMVNELNKKVCELPVPIFNQISDLLYKFDDAEPAELAKLAVLTCKNWKYAILAK